MSNLPPLRWVIPIALLVVLAGYRISALLAPTEDRIQRRMTHVLRAVEERNARRIKRAFMSFYADEDTGVTKEDISQAAEYIAFNPTRFRATLDPVDGLAFVDPPARDGAYERATIDLHILVESRPSKTSPYAPYWDVRARAVLENRDDRWFIVSTSGVNWDERP